MADTSVANSRALTYRDPTVSAAAALQLRRGRQQSLDALAEQTQQTADAASRVSRVFQDRANGYRAAQDAADQTAEGHSNKFVVDQQAEGSGAAASSQTDGQTTGGTEEQGADQAASSQTQPTVTFTTQQIAQEQMGIGLHVPPLQPADEAYRRAGAEPPLPSEESQPSLFALAV